MRDWFNQETTRQTFIRGLYMILFWLILIFAVYIFGIVVIVQFFFVLLTQTPNPQLLQLSRLLSAYMQQLLLFLTFNRESLPYPFGQWPSD